MTAALEVNKIFQHVFSSEDASCLVRFIQDGKQETIRDERFDKIVERFDRLEHKIGGLKKKFDGPRETFGGMEGMEVRMRNRMESLLKDHKIEIFNRLDNHFKWLMGIIITVFGLMLSMLLKLLL